jgi:hypothetical protein
VCARRSSNTGVVTIFCPNLDVREVAAIEVASEGPVVAVPVNAKGKAKIENKN